MSMNLPWMSTNTATFGHADHASQWLTRFSDLLSPNPCTYACFLVGHTRFSDQLCPNTSASFLVGQMPRQDCVTYLQCLSKAAKRKDTLCLRKSLSHKPREPGRILWGETAHACPVCASALAGCCSTVWDKIPGWTDLWSEQARPFLCPNAMLTASYVPCSLIYFDKDLF